MSRVKEYQKKKGVAVVKLRVGMKEKSQSNPKFSNLIKKLQLTVETAGCGDGTLKDEAGGQATSGLYASRPPWRHWPFSATDPQLRLS